MDTKSDVSEVQEEMSLHETGASFAEEERKPKKQRLNEENMFLMLPDEILKNILTYLNDTQTFISILRTSRTFYDKFIFQSTEDESSSGEQEGTEAESSLLFKTSHDSGEGLRLDLMESSSSLLLLEKNLMIQKLAKNSFTNVRILCSATNHVTEKNLLPYLNLRFDNNLITKLELVLMQKVENKSKLLSNLLDNFPNLDHLSITWLPSDSSSGEEQSTLFDKQMLEGKSLKSFYLFDLNERMYQTTEDKHIYSLRQFTETCSHFLTSSAVSAEETEEKPKSKASSSVKAPIIKSRGRKAITSSGALALPLSTAKKQTEEAILQHELDLYLKESVKKPQLDLVDLKLLFESQQQLKTFRTNRIYMEDIAQLLFGEKNLGAALESVHFDSVLLANPSQQLSSLRPDSTILRDVTISEFCFADFALIEHLVQNSPYLERLHATISHVMILEEQQSKPKYLLHSSSLRTLQLNFKFESFSKHIEVHLPYLRRLLLSGFTNDNISISKDTFSRLEALELDLIRIQPKNSNDSVAFLTLEQWLEDIAHFGVLQKIILKNYYGWGKFKLPGSKSLRIMHFYHFPNCLEIQILRSFPNIEMIDLFHLMKCLAFSIAVNPLQQKQYHIQTLITNCCLSLKSFEPKHLILSKLLNQTIKGNLPVNSTDLVTINESNKSFFTSVHAIPMISKDLLKELIHPTVRSTALRNLKIEFDTQNGMFILNEFETTALFQWIENCPNLETLSIKGVRISSYAAQISIISKSLKKLELELVPNQQSKNNLYVKCEQLSSFVVSKMMGGTEGTILYQCNQITQMVVSNIQNFYQLQMSSTRFDNLTKVCLVKTGVNSFERLLKFGPMPKLEHLYFEATARDVSVDDKNLSTFLDLAPHIKSLHLILESGLSRPSIKHTFLKVLAIEGCHSIQSATLDCPSLQHLVLYKNSSLSSIQIQDMSNLIVADLRYNPKLQSLQTFLNLFTSCLHLRILRFEGLKKLTVKLKNLISKQLTPVASTATTTKTKKKTNSSSNPFSDIIELIQKLMKEETPKKSKKEEEATAAKEDTDKSTKKKPTTRSRKKKASEEFYELYNPKY